MGNFINNLSPKHTLRNVKQTSMHGFYHNKHYKFKTHQQ